MAGCRVLAVDTSSPLVSVAVAVGGRLAGEATVAQRRSSALLLSLVDSALGDAGVTLGELDGIVALRGPGSFTGLRIGLATCLGLHQSTGVPATAVSTLEVLAAAAPAGSLATADVVVAAVSALRGEWFAQRFSRADPPAELGAPERLPLDELVALDFAVAIGFGLPEAAGGDDARLLEPGPLAPVAAIAASRRPPSWAPELLTRPLYLAAPAASLPGPPKSLLPEP